MRNPSVQRTRWLLPLAALLFAACGTAAPTPSQITSTATTPAPGSGELPSLVPGASFPVTSLVPGASLPVTQPTIGTTVTPPPITTKTPKPPKSPKPTKPPTEPPTAPPPPPTSSTGWPAGAISTTDAAGHVGETATVCGVVQSTNWVFAEKGHPTWLNMDSMYPNVTFNAVIWGEQRRAWPLSGKPDVVYLGKVICVTGVIEQYGGFLQIQDLSMDKIQVVQ